MKELTKIQKLAIETQRMLDEERETRLVIEREVKRDVIAFLQMLLESLKADEVTDQADEGYSFVYDPESFEEVTA